MRSTKVAAQDVWNALPAAVLRLVHAQQLAAIDDSHVIRAHQRQIEVEPVAWVQELFPRYVTHRRTGEFVPFGEHHEQAWSWLWALRPGVRPRSFVGMFARGGAKSTTAELGCAAVAARRTRRYGLYVSRTQRQANDHVQNVGMMLTSERFARVYPEVADARRGEYGGRLGWSRQRIMTASGFTLDAIGLDTAARGAKIDEARPDFLILDDIDKPEDSPLTIARTIEIITKALIPAGAPDLAIFAIQNKIMEEGFFGQLANGTADYLSDRILCGPIPAIRDMEYEQIEVLDDDLGPAAPPSAVRRRFVITGGTATWPGQTVEDCQELLDDIGLRAFLSECQHETEPPPGGMYDHIQFARLPWDAVPWRRIIRTVVWTDPAVTDKHGSDAHGIIADAIDLDGMIYRLWAWERQSTPFETMCLAILMAVRLGAEAVGIETDQGGDTWKSVFREAARELVRRGDLPVGTRLPIFREAKAGSGWGGKVHRAQQMLTDYEQDKIVHVFGGKAGSTLTTLERALRRFPKTKPLDLADAAFWGWSDLRRPKGTKAPTEDPELTRTIMGKMREREW